MTAQPSLPLDRKSAITKSGRIESFLQKPSVCAITAAILAVVGVIAVFITENEVGTATLLAIGCYFLIATFLGRFPKVTLAGNEITPELKEVKDELRDLSERVTKTFLSSMSPEMYGNLEKLGSGHFGPYEMSSALDRELRHLRDVGYIKVDSIKEIPEKEENLSKFITVTQTGKDYIKLRQEVNGRAPGAA